MGPVEPAPYSPEGIVFVSDSSAAHPHDVDRSTLVKTLGAEFDEMGWRNLRYIERVLTPYALTFPQAMVLLSLERLGPHLVMSSIAELTSLSASTVTSIMDRLVTRGLAERRPAPGDRRSVTGSITAEGRRILKEMQTARDASLSAVFAGFSNEELAVLLRFVERWADMTEEI